MNKYIRFYIIRNGFYLTKTDYSKKMPMPIAIISVDSLNNKLSDFKDLTSRFDIVYISDTEEGQNMYKQLLSMALIDNILVTDKLNPPSRREHVESVRQRFQDVVNECHDSCACIIVSHHSVINAWRPDFIKNEWEVIVD